MEGERLTESDVRFYHSANMRDAVSYIESGGVLSRENLSDLDKGYMKFWSDDDDIRKGVFGRVFGNLYDFGAIFPRSSSPATPNIYGPICFSFGPEVFQEMSDLVVTKESIVNISGPWRDHGISSDEEVSAMLAGNQYGDPLADSYKFAEASSANEILPFGRLEEIVVEPLTVEGDRLSDLIYKVAGHQGLGHLVKEREYSKPNQAAVLQSVVDSISNYEPRYDSELERYRFESFLDTMGQVPEWVSRRFELWADYFYRGTVLYLRESRS